MFKIIIKKYKIKKMFKNYYEFVDVFISFEFKISFFFSNLFDLLFFYLFRNNILKRIYIFKQSIFAYPSWYYLLDIQFFKHFYWVFKLKIACLRVFFKTHYIHFIQLTTLHWNVRIIQIFILLKLQKFSTFNKQLTFIFKFLWFLKNLF